MAGGLAPFEEEVFGFGDGKGFAERGCTPSQLALAWVLGKGEDVLPIPGTKRRKYLEENAGAVDIQLSVEDMAVLDGFFDGEAVKGQRYAEASMKMLNH